MDRLEWELKTMSFHNRDGSHATQHERWRHLQLFAKQLKGLGYQKLRAQSLKPKHVDALVNHWQCEVGSRGQPVTDLTIKNRLAHLRWWAQKIHKQNIIPRDNGDLGIRPSISFKSGKAGELDADKLALVSSQHIVMSLKLQRAFGLRREEAMKFRPHLADQGNHIRLSPAWCKGGRGREVPVVSDKQRLLLDEAKQLVGKQSLIPAGSTYRTHLKKWEFETHRMGLGNTHKLRHQYAQENYQRLTSFAAPAAGGPSREQLTDDQKVSDRSARGQIAEYLGHSRIGITNVYLGK